MDSYIEHGHNRMNDTGLNDTGLRNEASNKLVAEAHAQPCDSAKNQVNSGKTEDDEFTGLNLYFFKIGVKHHSLAITAQIPGLFHVNTSVGQVTGADVGVLGGALGAHAAAGVVIGKGLYTYANGGARAIVAGGNVEAAGIIDNHGLHTGYQAKADVFHEVAAGSQGHVGLGPNSPEGLAGVEGGVRVGHAKVGSGVEIKTQDSHGNPVLRPEVHVLKTQVGEEQSDLTVYSQVGPKADVRAGVYVENQGTRYDDNHGERDSLDFNFGESGVNLGVTRTFGKPFDY
jgi:hypothetical protein